MYDPKSPPGSLHEDGVPEDFKKYFSIPADQIAKAKKAVPAGLLEKTLFIVPANDGEAVRAHQWLEALGAPNVIKSGQGWGAVLDREKGWDAVLTDPKIENVVVFEMPGLAKEGEDLVEERRVREAGKNLILVDHHYYAQANRTNPVGSLEQLADILKWPMSRVDQEIAFNDKGYIPALKNMGLKEKEVARVRAYDYVGQGKPYSYAVEGQAGAQKALKAGEVPSASGMSILGVKELSADATFVKEALAMQSPTGVHDTFEFKNGGFGFSGSPEAVDRYLAHDFQKYGLVKSVDYDQYGGGQPPSKFCGFKPKSAKARAIFENAEVRKEIWQLFRPEVYTVPEIFDNGFK